MSQDNIGSNESSKHRITVEATHIEGIASALGMEIVESESENETDEFPTELQDVLSTLSDIYHGVEEATEQDSRGRSRKMVRQYADREELSSDQVGHILRVLEAHELVIQDGNRWRIPEDDSD